MSNGFSTPPPSPPRDGQPDETPKAQVYTSSAETIPGDQKLKTKLLEYDKEGTRDVSSVDKPPSAPVRRIKIFNTPRRSKRLAQLRRRLAQPVQPDDAVPVPLAPQKKKSFKQEGLPTSTRCYDRQGHGFEVLPRLLGLRPHADSVKPPETILAKLQEFNKTYSTGFFEKKDNTILQVVDISPEQVLGRILLLRGKYRKQGIPVPSRTEGSQNFSIPHDLWVQERRKNFTRVKKNSTTKEDNELYKRTYELFALIYTMCSTLRSMKLREIYYTSTQLYQSMKKVAAVVDDICCIMGFTRQSLLIFADEKGVVYGDISFEVDGHKYNGLAGGGHRPRGIDIPQDTRSISNIKSEGALFILVVEKGTIFERLAQDRFCQKYRCIMITGKGMPTVATRGFLRTISDQLKLRVFMLVDFNPYGLRIYSVYRYGSKSMCYDSENLATPNIELLGLRCADIEKFDIPEASIEKMTEGDIKAAKDLLDLNFMKEYHPDLLFMLDTNNKIQIEALYTHGIDYLAEVALPLMLYQKLSELLDRYYLKWLSDMQSLEI